GEPQAETRVRARRGVEAIQRGIELGEPGQHSLEALAGPTERLGLGLADLPLDLPVALLAAPGAAHSTATSRISHRCRPRKRVMLSSVSTGATASTLTRSGRMCRTSGYETSTRQRVRTRGSRSSRPRWPGIAQSSWNVTRIARGPRVTPGSPPASCR